MENVILHNNIDSSIASSLLQSNAIMNTNTIPEEVAKGYVIRLYEEGIIQKMADILKEELSKHYNECS